MSTQTKHDRITEQSTLLLIMQRLAQGGSFKDIVTDVLSAVADGSQADGVRLLLFNPADPTTPSTVFAAGTSSATMAAYDSAILANPSAPIPTLKGEQVVLPLAVQHERFGVLWANYTTSPLEPAQRTFLQIVALQLATLYADRRTLDQLSAIVNHSADPIIAITPQGLISLVNAAVRTALDNPTLAPNQVLADVVQDEQIVGLLTSNQTLKEWSNEADSTFIPRTVDLTTTDGSSQGRVLILRDVTESKRMRQKESDLVGTVSHDLRSPLTFIKGYVDMVAMVGPVNDKQKAFIDRTITGINQMTEMVEKILDGVRLDPEGDYQISREPVDVVKMVQEIVQQHIEPAERKSQTLTSDIDPNLPILNLDQGLVRRALNNLVDNAVKYTPTGGRINVAAKIQDNQLQLSVQDTGLGISEENQKHLFERFKRVYRKEHVKVKGTGLGLFIVRGVAQRHGGDASVVSKEGQGSTFYITIPLDGPNMLSGLFGGQSPV